MKKLIIFSLIFGMMLSIVGIVNAIDYTDFVDQGIIFSPDEAYYPTVIYDGSQYFMLHDKLAQSAVSNDGITWTVNGIVTGLTNARHMVMLYDKNKFEGTYNYKIWYFDSGAAVQNGAGSIRYAESNDGITWVNDQAVFGGNMITPGIDNVDAPSRTWGPGAVIYNPEATNTGSNPLDYSYVMYYDGYDGNTDDSTWDNTEALFLAYSSDGINWNRYTRNPVLKGGSVSEWDNGGVGYPTVMQIEGGSYVMWYGGGPGTNEGIGFATSLDGIIWTKDGSNPMLHINNGYDYRAERTYTPRVINDGTGVLKMYYSAKSDLNVYAVGLATLEIDLQPTGEITSPDENEIVFGSVEFTATYTDDDPSYVSWAVRKGTCAAGQGTVFGNVDTYHDPYSWDGSLFTATADTSSWEPGEYCFVFNPKEEPDENDIKLTREFVLVGNTKADILMYNGVPGKGIANAPGLQKAPPNDHFAKNQKFTLPENASYTKYHGNGIYSTTHVVRKDFVRPDKTKSAKTTGPACYKLMGVSWAEVPDYVAQSQDLLNIAKVSIETWDAVTGFELLGNGEINKDAGFGDISEPKMDTFNSYSYGDYPTTGVIAVCRTWWNTEGDIIEYDIMFDTDFDWGDATLDSTVMDLQNIATHEIGHGLGLLDLYNRPCKKQTMYGYSWEGDIQKRDLESGDIAGLNILYGN